MDMKKMVSKLHRDDVKKVNKKHVTAAAMAGAVTIFASDLAVEKYVIDKPPSIIINEQVIEERIEKTIAHQLGKIQTIIYSRFETLEENVENITVEIDKQTTALENDISIVSTNMGKKITDIQSNIDTISNRVSDIEYDVEESDTTLSTLKSDIVTLSSNTDKKIKSTQNDIKMVSDKVDEIPSEYTNNTELDDLIKTIVASQLIGMESSILRTTKQFVDRKINELPPPPVTQVIDEKLLEERIKQELYYDLVKLETKIIKRIQEQFNTRISSIEDSVKEIQDDKVKKRNSIQQYTTLITAQQNLLATLQVYNNLYQMVKTKDGRNFIGNEINNIKVVNQRLIKLRRQIYSDATKSDKQIIFDLYQNMIRMYKPVIPKDEIEEDIDTNSSNDTS